MEETSRIAKVTENCQQEIINKSDSFDPAIPGPIYFLVREHAKLMVTIKEIQGRLKALEETQHTITTTVQDIHYQMNIKDCNNIPSKVHLNRLAVDNIRSFENETKMQNFSAKMLSNSHRSLPIEGHIQDSQKSDNLNLNHYEKIDGVENSDIISSSNHVSPENVFEEDSEKLLVVDFDNKQDSGLESDHGQGLNPQTTNSSGIFSNGLDKNITKDQDELLVLLDIINEKGLSLRQEIEDLKECSNSDTKNTNIDQEMTRLHSENLNLEQLIGEVENEKSSMKIKLAQLEIASHELKHENKKLVENLELALSEKQQLEMKIHSLHFQFVKGASIPKAESWPPIKIPETEKSRKFTKENNFKVSHILKETNVLKLQRKLLVYLMENEVLYAKLWHADQSLSTRMSEWKKTEVDLHNRIRHLMSTNEELQIKLGENNLELTAAQAKVQMLEKVLSAVTQDTRDAFELGNPYRVSNKGFSLPPVLRDACVGYGHYCKEIKPFPDQSAHIDVSLIPLDTSQKCQNSNEEKYIYLCGNGKDKIECLSNTTLKADGEWCSSFRSTTDGNNGSSETPTTKVTSEFNNLFSSESDEILLRTNICTSTNSVLKCKNIPHIWRSDSNVKNSQENHNCLFGSSLNDSTNANNTDSMCQIDRWLQENEAIDSRPIKSLNQTNDYEFATQTKNSVDIRQQIQDILDHVTCSVTTDEALV